MRVYSLKELDQYAIRFLKVCQGFDPILFSIYSTQYKTGCRFADVYYLQNWSLIDDKIVVLTPRKKNDKRIFTLSELDPLLVQQLQQKINIYNMISYSTANYYFLRMFPKPNLMIKNKSVNSHIFRHIKAKKLKQQNKSDLEIQEFLGERSLLSTQAYIYSTIYSK